MLSINAQAYENGLKGYRNIFPRGSIASKYHQKGKALFNKNKRKNGLAENRIE